MDEVSGIADQLPLQLCVLGDSLAKDAVFLNICRGFQVAKIYFFDHINIQNWQVPVVTSENGEGFFGRESGGVRTVFVHETFSGERCALCIFEIEIRR